MSTVEGFDLHVYCDGRDAAGKPCIARDEYAGVDRGDAVRNARSAGWLISSKPAPSDAAIGGGKFVLCKNCRRRGGQ